MFRSCSQSVVVWLDYEVMVRIVAHLHMFVHHNSKLSGISACSVLLRALQYASLFTVIPTVNIYMPT